MTKIWKKVNVTLEVELEIGIEEEELTLESIEEFRKHFWYIEDENGLFETVADQYVRNGGSFIEGVGHISTWDNEVPINVTQISEDVEVVVE